MEYSPQRPSAATPQPKLGLSRAKTQRPQRSENNGEKFSKIIHLFPPNLACFAPWRESIPRVRVFQITGKFARAAQTFKHSSTRFFPDCAGKKRFACRRTAATETRNISRKDAKAAKVGKNGENHLREYFTFPSELGAFAPWREEFPNPRTFDFRNI